MKKSYVTPKLIVHGDVEKITLGAGSQTLADLFSGNFADPFGVPRPTGSR